jgi:ADP-heptose:LPS heptosyltransferase
MRLIKSRKNKISPERINKVCIDCSGLIGDTLMRTKFIEAVAKNYIQAEIDVIAYMGRGGLLVNHPNVSRVFEYKKGKFAAKAREILFLIKKLRAQRYDIYYDLYSGGASRFIAFFSASKYRIGFSGGWIQSWPYSFYTERPRNAGHLLRSLYPLLVDSLESIKNDSLTAGATFIPSNIARDNVLRQYSENLSGIILLNLGGGDPKKLWPTISFVSITEWLIIKKRKRVGVFVNPGQEYLFEAYQKLLKERFGLGVLIIKNSSFDEIGVIMENAGLVVTGDTGYMHLAIGVNAPVLGIFTHTRPDDVEPDGVKFWSVFNPSEDLKDGHGRPLGGAISIDDVKSSLREILR